MAFLATGQTLLCTPGWVELDKKVSARLFANGLKHEGRVEVLRKNYYECVRYIIFEYVSDLNDIALDTQL